ncbi:MAG TPA: hypothetical protein VFS33_04675 [Gemmatimonadales bacterium]|nr:hypothetical protein [Gemmatimonadales bacterium]
MRGFWLTLGVAACCLAAGCKSSVTAGTGRTERERDSIIGQSKLPGAAVVGKALQASDSAAARRAAQDSAAAAP